MSLTAGKALLAVVGITTPIGSFAADFFGTTHIFNPRWTPHAKFHTAQTLSFSIVLGFSTLYFLFVPHKSSAGLGPSARLAIEKQRLDVAALIASMYWITQFAAIFYPECLCLDPEFGQGCPQMYIDSLYLSVVLGGYLLARRGIAAKGVAEKSK